MRDVVSEYFGRPNEFGEINAEHGSRGRQGFFRYQGIPCFGSLSSTETAPDLQNAPDITSVRPEGGPALSLPFDPGEVVANLRYERYINNDLTLEKDSLIRNAYYVLRRLLPVEVRKHLQRYRLRDWDGIEHPAWPVDTSVDDLCAELLKDRLRASGDQRWPFIWFWPEGLRGCLMITHDVESAKGRDFCETLCDVDRSYGFVSSFELIPEKRYAISEKFLEGIRSSGFEICLHGLCHDGHLFREKEEFLHRAEAIGQYARAWGAVGFRSPVMYRNPDWLAALEIDYDMSWPSVGHLDPQRGGCCTVMPYFIGDIIELPLTMTQDYSLFHILRRHDTQLWRDQMERILSRNGLVSCIVHPDYITEARELAVYRDLLELFRQTREERRLWTALPKEIALWWRNRRAMRMVKGGTTWRVEGPGSERARIAWAAVDNGQLRYSIEGDPSTP
jgi:hypothetical protein